jgi:hypothetical protein
LVLDDNGPTIKDRNPVVVVIYEVPHLLAVKMFYKGCGFLFLMDKHCQDVESQAFK